jgi:hypothetical protein
MCGVFMRMMKDDWMRDELIKEKGGRFLFLL